MEKEEPQLRADLHLDDQFIITTLLASVLFFAVINELLCHASKRYVILRRTSEWRLRNLAVSWVHADLCSIGIIYCYCKYGQYIQTFPDLFDVRPLAAYLLVAFSTGYFMYDFLEHIRQGKALVLWEVMLHHFSVVSIFTYNLIYHFCVAFAVLALIVEINSVFLHGRKLLQMCDVPFSHWLYRTIVALNLVTFVIFRGMALTLIWMGFLSNLHRCSAVYKVALSTVMVFFVILNPLLFWRLLKNDLLRSRRKKTTQENGAVGRQPDDHGETETLQNGEGSHNATAEARLINSVSSKNGFNVTHRAKAS